MSYKIPVKKLPEGIRHCANNIRRFLQDVELLLKNSSEWHATAMAIFAYEELAKYAELKKAKSKANDEDVEIDERLFGKGHKSHKYKQQIAYKLLENKETVILLAKADLPKFEETKDVEISNELRLDCIFVDWKNGNWVHGQPYLPNKILKFKEEILNALNRLESN